MRVFTITLLMGFCLSAANVHAQTNSAASNLGAENQGDEAAQSQIAAVGAGTSNGVTTGVSGPDQGGGLAPGELPPLPSAELCTTYQDPLTRASCLAVVLAEQEDEEP